ncbi:MAG: DUF559 domain-containing protein [Archangium sp.]
MYRIVGAPETWLQRVRALNLWLDHGFAISHTTAAALHRFPNFFEGPLVATVGRFIRRREGVKLHRAASLHSKDIASVAGLRVTSPTRTLIDLAGELHADALRHCVNDALRFRWTTLDRLEACLERSGARPGGSAIRALIHEFRGGNGPTEGELERRVLHVLELANFPEPDHQRPVYVGGRLRRLDFLFTNHQLVIEADGYAYHSSVDVFEDDRSRNNALTSRGFRVLHWTWKALHEFPERLTSELASCLRRGS